MPLVKVNRFPESPEKPCCATVHSSRPCGFLSLCLTWCWHLSKEKAFLGQVAADYGLAFFNLCSLSGDVTPLPFSSLEEGCFGLFVFVLLLTCFFASMYPQCVDNVYLGSICL